MAPWVSEESGDSFLVLSLPSALVLHLVDSYITDDKTEPQRSEIGRISFLGPPVY